MLTILCRSCRTKTTIAPGATYPRCCTKPSLINENAIASTVKVAGKMNGTEAAYAIVLEERRRLGLITEWKYEPDRLSLGFRCKYVPDFRVTMPDGSIQYHEIKGSKRSGRYYSREKGIIKVRVAATRYSDKKFVIAWRVRGEWKSEEVKAEASG